MVTTMTIVNLSITPKVSCTPLLPTPLLQVTPDLLTVTMD